MGGSARDRLNRLFLWLSLAVIFTHALLPLGSPLVRGSGSAFSAYTSEVSLGSRSSPAKSKRQDGAVLEPSDPVEGAQLSAAEQDEHFPPARPRAMAAARLPASEPPRMPLRRSSGTASPFDARAPPAA